MEKNWYSQNGENELSLARWVGPLPRPVTSWPPITPTQKGGITSITYLNYTPWRWMGGLFQVPAVEKFRGNYDKAWWPVVMSCSIIPTQLLLHPDFWVLLPKTKSSPQKMGRAPKGKDRLPTTMFQGQTLSFRKCLTLLLWKTYPGLPSLP